MTLENCLSQFVRPEMISNVTCQKCTDIAVNDTTTNMSNFVKRQAFARLPAVLCLHIQRLAWLSDGRLAKKAQVIHFPEKLTMDSYIFTFTKDNHKSPLDSLPLVGGNSQFNCDTTQNPNPSTFTYIHGQQYGQAGDSHANHSLADSSSPSSPAKHLYALCAVVVHLGGPFNGHYVCYRKLQIGDKIQWFYVSDETVVPCSLQKVLSVPAYMLFYEKQSNT